MVTIFSDTTSSLPKKVFDDLGIPLLPQIIIFGEEQYRDDTELDTASFLKKLKNSTTLPKTSAPPPDLYHPLYKKYLDRGDSVIVITPSADVSGTYRAAMIAAEDFPGAPIHVIDARTIAGGLGSIVLEAHKLAVSGASTDQVIALINDLVARQKVYFLVDTLDYLYKGGRIGGASHLIGSILQVKPILTEKDGRVDTADKQQTKKKALAKIIQLISQDCPRDASAMVTVMHIDAEDEALDLKKTLENELGITDIPVYLLPSAIVVHAGPKALAISYFTSKP